MRLFKWMFSGHSATTMTTTTTTTTNLMILSEPYESGKFPRQFRIETRHKNSKKKTKTKTKIPSKSIVDNPRESGTDPEIRIENWQELTAEVPPSPPSPPSPRGQTKQECCPK